MMHQRQRFVHSSLAHAKAKGEKEKGHGCESIVVHASNEIRSDGIYNSPVARHLWQRKLTLSSDIRPWTRSVYCHQSLVTGRYCYLSLVCTCAYYSQLGCPFYMNVHKQGWINRIVETALKTWVLCLFLSTERVRKQTVFRATRRCTIFMLIKRKIYLTAENLLPGICVTN